MAAAVPYIVAAATVGSAYAGIRSSRNAAKATEIQYQEQAKDEQSAARDREIERRRNLVRALSSQAAAAGAAGIDPSVGTRKAIAITDIKNANTDSLVDRSRSNRRSLLLRQAGSNARAQGNLQAAGTALDAGASVAGINYG